MWEGRLPLAALISTNISRDGSSDLVTVETKHGQIQWVLKNGQSLIDAIERSRG